MSSSRVPVERCKFNHFIEVQLRFNDADIFGHINNSAYLQFFDLAKMQYFNTVMGKGFDIRHVALVVANINCDFHAPSFLREHLVVKTATLGISERSLLLEQRIVEKSTGELKCICRTIMVGFNPSTNESQAIADDARHRLEAFEGRALPPYNPES